MTTTVLLRRGRYLIASRAGTGQLEAMPRLDLRTGRVPRTNQHVRHCHAARSAPANSQTAGHNRKTSGDTSRASGTSTAAVWSEPAQFLVIRSPRPATGASRASICRSVGDGPCLNTAAATGPLPESNADAPHRGPQTHESAQTGAAVLHRGRQATPQPLLIQNEHTETGSAPIAFRSCSRSSSAVLSVGAIAPESSSPSDAVKKERTRQITS